MPRTPFDHVRAVVLGLAVVLVPMSLLKGASLVDFPGGRSLLPVADMDTILIDVVIVYFLVALWHRRRSLGDSLSFVIFGLIVSCATGVLLGYVVTNYGTLVRMRPMVLVPLWAIAVAMSQAGKRDVKVNVPAA